jgi:hypothetical protein
VLVTTPDCEANLVVGVASAYTGSFKRVTATSSNGAAVDVDVDLSDLFTITSADTACPLRYTVAWRAGGYDD